MENLAATKVERGGDALYPHLFSTLSGDALQDALSDL